MAKISNMYVTSYITNITTHCTSNYIAAEEYITLSIKFNRGHYYTTRNTFCGTC